MATLSPSQPCQVQSCLPCTPDDTTQVRFDFTTGIAALDKLLGGYIPPGSIVLLRGGPGSGKTTLALQMLQHQLHQTSGLGAFAALESDISTVINIGNNNFGFDLPLADDALGQHLYIEQTDIARLLKRMRLIKLCIKVGRWLPFLAKMLSYFAGVPFVTLPKGKSIIRKKAVWTLVINPIISLVAEKIRSRKVARPGHVPAPPPLIIIDSLNVLGRTMSDVSYRAESPELEMRAAFKHVCDAVREQIPEAIVLFIGEYYPQGGTTESLISESFFCDVEIVLTGEPVAREGTGGVARRTPTGYSIERTYGTQYQARETRPFCRVLKSRGTANQARRCAYDIVTKKGLVFYETYPGDGKVFLFAENEPQQEDWKDFFLKDIPELYPALRYEAFDRSGLQRTFASQRGFRHKPLRTDLYLASFDTYWVCWYQQLCQKWDLAHILREARNSMTSDDVNVRSLLEQVDKFGDFVCSIHRSLTESHESDPISELSTIFAKVFGTTYSISECLFKAFQDIIQYFTSLEGQGGLLRWIPNDELRLYGEVCSDLMPELRQLPGTVPTLVRENWSKTPGMFSIPYNANTSFLVYRRDLLRNLCDRTSEAEMVSRMIEIYHARCKYLGKPPCEEELLRSYVDKRVTALMSWATSRRAVMNYSEVNNQDFPQTWEELIALCLCGNTPPLQFLIETQTFDTFLCTFLETLWSCNGSLVVHPDYAVDNKSTTICRIQEAMFYFHYMFECGVIPKNSSLEPKYLSRFNTKARETGDKRIDWLFARHWYSTLVDVLTKQHEEGESDSKEFIWKQDNVELEIMPIPTTLSLQLAGNDTCHHSCSGEWHLAVLAGSENSELAYAIINDLMSSQKICDRAFRGAALPTVKEFYSHYGDVKCLNFPDRHDMKLPSIRFRQMFERFVGTARSRSEVFDYRHCMRKIHPILEYVHAFPECESTDVRARIERALDEIEELRYKAVLTH